MKEILADPVVEYRADSDVLNIHFARGLLPVKTTEYGDGRIAVHQYIPKWDVFSFSPILTGITVKGFHTGRHLHWQGGDPIVIDHNGEESSEQTRVHIGGDLHVTSEKGLHSESRSGLERYIKEFISSALESLRVDLHTKGYLLERNVDYYFGAGEDVKALQHFLMSFTLSELRTLRTMMSLTVQLPFEADTNALFQKLEAHYRQALEWDAYRKSGEKEHESDRGDL